MMLYIAVGAAILVFIILLILVISKMRKKNKAVPEVVNNDEVVEPVADTTVEVNEPVVETTEESVVPGDNSEGSTDDKVL